MEIELKYYELIKKYESLMNSQKKYSELEIAHKFYPKGWFRTKDFTLKINLLTKAIQNNMNLRDIVDEYNNVDKK